MSEEKKEIIRLIREEFDPTPPNWEGPDWHDNAEEVAVKIEALFPASVCTWPGCGRESFCLSGDFGGQLICRQHYDLIHAGLSGLVLAGLAR